jgi:hypothetical protein
MSFYDRLGNPEPTGPDPKDDPTVPKLRFTVQRGGVGPGKGAKDDKPTKPGEARLPVGNVRMW